MDVVFKIPELKWVHFQLFFTTLSGTLSQIVPFFSDASPYSVNLPESGDNHENIANDAKDGNEEIEDAEDELNIGIKYQHLVGAAGHVHHFHFQSQFLQKRGGEKIN